MVSIEASLERRRRRGQNEINVLVREFSEPGLSQNEFTLKVGVHPLTVARWVESCAGKSLTDGPTSTSPASPFVAGQLQSGRSVPNTANPVLPEVVAPTGWKLGNSFSTRMVISIFDLSITFLFISASSTFY